MAEYRKMSHDRFVQCIDILSVNLEKYLNDNKLKVDYICPIIRSGAVPAVYLANKLNIVKFAPLQIKHISYKDGRDTIETIFNPLELLDINKEKPVFLIVDALQSSGISGDIAIKEIKKVYCDAIVLYVCISKKYQSRNFEGVVNYFDFVFEYNEEQLSEDECLNLGIDYYVPAFPWENAEEQITHPDDNEENIFF